MTRVGDCQIVLWAIMADEYPNKGSVFMREAYMKKALWVIIIVLIGLIALMGLALAYNPPPQEMSGLFI
jgi:hypothetical protein